MTFTGLKTEAGTRKEIPSLFRARAYACTLCFRETYVITLVRISVSSCKSSFYGKVRPSDGRIRELPERGAHSFHLS